MGKKLCYLIQRGNVSPCGTKLAEGSREWCQLWLVRRDKQYNYSFYIEDINVLPENYGKRYNRLPVIDNSERNIHIWEVFDRIK